MARIGPHQLARSGTEDGHQAALFCWIADGLAEGTVNPKLKLLYAIPNGGSRGGDERSRAIAGGKMKATGTKTGVPDTHLPVSRRGYHSLYIELKRVKSQRGAAGRTFESQDEWHVDLREEGNAVVVCYGWEEARDCLLDYLKEG